jgi:hypothetical protein
MPGVDFALWPRDTSRFAAHAKPGPAIDERKGYQNGFAWNRQII